MKLIVYNNENCVVENGGNSIFRISKRGYCTITNQGLRLLGIKVGDRIELANEEGTKNWFIRKVNTNDGFLARKIASSVGFKNSAFNEAFTKKLKLEGTVGFLIGKTPIEADGGEYFPLITTRPIVAEPKRQK